MNIKSEAQAEIVLWDWLRNYGEVYFNRKNALNWQTFRTEGETKEIPDLLFITTLFGKEEAIAIEVKDGDESSSVRQGNKIFGKYLLNYISKKTKYFIGDKEIKINRFIMATQYSPQGKLFGRGDEIISNSKEGKHEWQNRIVPKLEFVRTKEFGRNLLQNYSEYRKINNVKESVSLGWIISDIVLNFTQDELEIQSGMVGKPILQGISWNYKLNRWSQFLIKL